MTLHIALIIIDLIILYVFWDSLFYIVGGIFGLIATFFLYVTYTSYSYKEKQLSDDEWLSKNEGKIIEDRSLGKGTIIFSVITTLICGGISYKAKEKGE